MCNGEQLCVCVCGHFLFWLSAGFPGQSAIPGMVLHPGQTTTGCSASAGWMDAMVDPTGLCVFVCVSASTHTFASEPRVERAPLSPAQP